MKLVSRVAATATAVLSISVLSMPLAGAAEAASSQRGDNAKIRVCINGDRGAAVRVAGQFKRIDDGDCETFRGLDRGRTYRVTAFEPRRCDIRNEVKFVRANRDTRTVSFNVRCFGRGGNNGNGFGNGNNNGGRDGNFGGRDGMRDGQDRPRGFVAS
ncbi:MAG: hypothetical protein ACT4QF_00735 [Sporichthyaceae bacterium]